MSERNADDWNEDQLREFDQLARELEPPASLEARTAARLQSEGLLGRVERRSKNLRSAWASAAAAAVLAAFLGGLSLGQHLGNRSAVETMNAMRSEDPHEAAVRVQRTGTAYVAALAALAQLNSERQPAQRSSDFVQGQEAAAALLRAAATELVQLDPNDPIAVRILQGLEDQRRRTAAEEESKPRRVFWY